MKSGCPAEARICASDSDGRTADRISELIDYLCAGMPAVLATDSGAKAAPPVAR